MDAVVAWFAALGIFAVLWSVMYFAGHNTWLWIVFFFGIGASCAAVLRKNYGGHLRRISMSDARPTASVPPVLELQPHPRADAPAINAGKGEAAMQKTPASTFGSALDNIAGTIVMLAAKAVGVLIILHFLNRFWGLDAAPFTWTPTIGTFKLTGLLYVFVLLGLWSTLERDSAHRRPLGEGPRLFDLIPSWVFFLFFVVTLLHTLIDGAPTPEDFVILFIFIFVAFRDLRNNSKHRQPEGVAADVPRIPTYEELKGEVDRQVRVGIAAVMLGHEDNFVLVRSHPGEKLTVIPSEATPPATPQA